MDHSRMDSVYSEIVKNGIHLSTYPRDESDGKFIMKKYSLKFEDFNKNKAFFYSNIVFGMVVWRMEINTETFMKSGNNGIYSHSHGLIPERFIHEWIAFFFIHSAPLNLLRKSEIIVT